MATSKLKILFLVLLFSSARAQTNYYPVYSLFPNQTVPATIPALDSGKYLYNDGNTMSWQTVSGSGTGTVTSVDMTVPAIFSLSGNPITASGTLAVTLTSQTTNKVFAAPNGSTGTPTFRALVAADIPSLSYEPVITAGTSGQYWRGDKSWQTLDKTAVGLGNVTNNLQLVAANNLSDLVSAVTARTNLGLGTLATQSGTFSGTSSGTNTGDITIAGENYLSLSSQVLTANAVNLSGSNVTGTLAAGRFPALTGDLTNSAGALSTTVGAIQNKSITLATGYLKYTGSAFTFDNSTFLTGNQTITLSGDISGSGSTAITTAIGNDKVLTANILNSNVTLAKIASIADQRILGNNSGGSAAPLAMTAAQTKTLLAIANTDVSGLGTASTHASTDFAASGANTDITSVLLNQTGLVIKGGDANALTIKLNETMTAGRILYLKVNDLSRTIDLSGNLTVSGAATISGTNTGDQDLSGYVPTTRTVNGHALSSNVTVTASDLSLGSVENTALSTWAGTSNITTLGTISTGVWNATKLSEVYGGTNQVSYTLGDVLYSSASNTLSKLAGNTTTTKKYLSQTGNGSVSAAPSWSAVSLSPTTYDLSTPGTGFIVRDSDIADVLIVATSSPATAQWKFGIRAQDLPTAAIIQDYAFIATFGGKNNNGASARTINWRFSVNNVDKGSAASGSVPTATPFWKAAVYGGLAAGVVVGDTIGLKLWGSVTNDLDFRYITIYFVARFFTPGTGFLQAASGFTALHQATIAGAVSGVTYTATTPSGVQPSFYDNTTSTLMGSFTSGLVYTIGSTYRLSQTNTITDNNNFIGLATTASAGLYSLSGGTSSFLKYLYLFNAN